MRVRYHGWSGISAHYSSATVGFDLMDADALGGESGRDRLLCVTHGHPDHCGALLEGSGSGLDGVDLVSSTPVVEHFAGVDGIDETWRFQARDARVVGAAGGMQVTAIDWVHMPLLPPGVDDKVDYLAHLAARPIKLAEIATTGLRLPTTSPTLGFHLAPGEGPTLLNYAEGLHRMTAPEEVANVARRFPDLDVLVSAVEPEDREAVPRWIERLAPSRVFLYEAHRPWREAFGLETMDLVDYAEGLDRRLGGVRVEALAEPGVEVTL